MHPLLDLARQAIAANISGAPLPTVGRGDGDASDQERLPSQGVFVTLFSPGKQLRGCIGRMQPMHTDLRDEIATCAVAAATRDPRFPPVERHELEQLELEISLLGPEERVGDERALDPRRFGVVVRHAGRTGVLLPEVQGVDSAREQVAIALRKGGIDPASPYELTRFPVTKLKAAEGEALAAS
jgi:AmmeMemoRadiSam system protein A